MQTLADLYQHQLDTGAISPDPAQAEAVAHLIALQQALLDFAKHHRPNPFAWLLKRRRAHEAPRGLYLWGGVGRGKTMLMDLFYRTTRIKRKRRVHFHEFMSQIHQQIHHYRQTHRDQDPIMLVADTLAGQAWLLCFDEFAVTDITDAMILGRLFEALFARGVVVVATSNVPPARLYEGGLNRALFLPFIAHIEARMEVHELSASRDFRLEKLSSETCWYIGSKGMHHQALNQAFTRLSDAQKGEPATLHVMGRIVTLPQAHNGVARASFAQLCAQPLGPSDYVAIAHGFQALILDDIPIMDVTARNEARRFIWLIDALYDSHVKLIASAAGAPDALYQADTGQEVFEFQRTASRLIEMQSYEYLALPHGTGASEASGEAEGLVET